MCLLGRWRVAILTTQVVLFAERTGRTLVTLLLSRTALFASLSYISEVRLANDGEGRAPEWHASASYAAPGIGQQKWVRHNRVAGTWAAAVGHMVRASFPSRVSCTEDVVRGAGAGWAAGVRGRRWWWDRHGAGHAPCVGGVGRRRRRRAEDRAAGAGRGWSACAGGRSRASRCDSRAPAWHGRSHAMGRTGTARRVRATARGGAGAAATDGGRRAGWSGRGQTLVAHKAGAGWAAGRGRAGERRRRSRAEGGRRAVEEARGCLWKRVAEGGNGSAVSGHP